MRIRPFLLILMLCVSFGTAMASFAYEIGWIRMLALVLGSATHAFELMLSAFILGLALGAWWIADRADRSGDPLRLLYCYGIMTVVFSAVLNNSWVLWYFRRPALVGLGTDADELLQIFPSAELTKKQEVKLRIQDLETAYAVLGWVLQNG